MAFSYSSTNIDRMVKGGENASLLDLWGIAMMLSVKMLESGSGYERVCVGWKLER